MLLHEAFDKTLKYCRITATELTKLSGVSSSRISQFRNGLFLEGKGSDLTSRSVDELLKAVEQIEPKAKLVFALFLADEDPAVLSNCSWPNSILVESMEQAQLSQLLIAIADALDKSKAGESRLSHKSGSYPNSRVDVLTAS